MYVLLSHLPFPLHQLTMEVHHRLLLQEIIFYSVMTCDTPTIH